MAEFVELDLEASIQELEHLVALNLFEEAEVKKLVQQRRDNSYNIRKRVKDKNDFLRYIRFEEELLRKIRDKRRKTGIKTRKEDIDFQITRRLLDFFRRTVEHYKADIDLWMDYFRFCDSHREYRLGNKMLQQLFQVHADKPHLWMFASQWALKKKRRSDKTDYDMGRTWLVKGIERHPKNKELYTALISFDLDIAEMEEKKKSPYTEAKAEEKIKIALACAEVSYRNAVKAIQDPGFVADLVKIISQYPLSEKLQALAIKDLEEGFLESEDSWNSRAQWAHQNATSPLPLDDPSELQRYRTEKCIEIYQNAVERIPTQLMWSKYIEWLTSQCKETHLPGHPNIRTLLFKAALPDVIQHGLGAVNHFTELADYYLNSGNAEKAADTLKKGLETFPMSPALWYELIRVHLMFGNEELALLEFKNAIKQLKELPAADSLRIWTMVTGYLMEEKNKEQTAEVIFQEGMRYKIDVAQHLKPRYLQFRMMAFGIEKARELFNMPHVTNPPCLAFYKKMTEIELSQPQLNLSRIRQCFETVLRNFGKDNADLWLDLIQFERDHGDITQVTKIYQRGLHTLNEHQADILVAKYSLSF